METPSTASVTGRCKHWLLGDYNGPRGHCPHCEIEALRSLVIECRSSVEFDLLTYERMARAYGSLGGLEVAQTHATAEAEAQRLHELLKKIDQWC